MIEQANNNDLSISLKYLYSQHEKTTSLAY